MKNNYSKMIRSLSSLLLIFMSLISYSQDIHFTFANAQNTNDGVDDYYEVDVMIQTINSTGSFKLGSGQLYFNYNTAAFGTNVFANSGVTITQPNPDYICGQYVDIAAAGIYYNFTLNDNTISKLSWAFSQFYSSATFADDNVGETPVKLIHLKFKYIDINELPMVLFEDGGSFGDQFFTACGPDPGGILEPATCGVNPGIQLLNDTFDSGGATLKDKDFALLTGITLYPNPTNGILNIEGDTSKIQSIAIYNIVGQHVKTISNQFKTIDIGNLESGLYLLKVAGDSMSFTTRVIKN